MAVICTCPWCTPHPPLKFPKKQWQWMRYHYYDSNFRGRMRRRRERRQQEPRYSIGYKEAPCVGANNYFLGIIPRRHAFRHRWQYLWDSSYRRCANPGCTAKEWYWYCQFRWRTVVSGDHNVEFRYREHHIIDGQYPHLKNARPAPKCSRVLDKVLRPPGNIW